MLLLPINGFTEAIFSLADRKKDSQSCVVEKKNSTVYLTHKRKNMFDVLYFNVHILEEMNVSICHPGCFVFNELLLHF